MHDHPKGGTHLAQVVFSSWLWKKTIDGFFPRVEAGEDASCALLLLFLVLGVLQGIFLALIHQCLQTEAYQIEFDTVANADCFDKDDEERIWADIGDDTDKIDETIN